jgi:hypothetical protein
MLDGINVLYQEEVQILQTHLHWWFIIVVLIGFVTMIAIFLLLDELLAAPEIVTKAAAIIWVFVVIFFCSKWCIETDTTYETHYGVTIDDNVKQNEFNKKYEIVEQKDKFYIIKERTVEK